MENNSEVIGYLLDTIKLLEGKVPRKYYWDLLKYVTLHSSLDYDTVTPNIENNKYTGNSESFGDQSSKLLATIHWKAWEYTAQTCDDVFNIINKILRLEGHDGRTFAWRGQSDAKYPLYSSLYRRTRLTNNNIPLTETGLQKEEHRVVSEVFRWGLHNAEFGRLSVLNQLSVLQHYGAPTRLIDITFNPWIALWFATAERYKNGEEEELTDARLFAFDVTNRMINTNDKLKEWEDFYFRPWVLSEYKVIDGTMFERVLRRWSSDFYAWRPPHFHPRIAAQNGGFILGGVPTGSVKFLKSPEGDRAWTVREAREISSIALKLHAITDDMAVYQDPVFTIRVSKNAISDIRKVLKHHYDYDYRTIYPDYTGFSMYATMYLKNV